MTDVIKVDRNHRARHLAANNANDDDFAAPEGQNKGRRPNDSQGRTVRPDQSWRWVIIALVIVGIAMMLVPNDIGAKKSKALTYSEFMRNVSSQNTTEQLDTIVIDNTTGQITGKFKNDDPSRPKDYRVNGPSVVSLDDITKMRESNINVDFKKPKKTGILDYLLPFVPLVIILVIFIAIMRRQAQGQVNGVMSIGRSKAKVYTTERPDTTFADVAGYKGAKQEISEVVDFLKDSKRFESIGAKIPKGVLLVGPPGTGKTLLARAVAGEAGVPFLSVTGSDFMEMFVGVGASRVRDLFQTARKNAPAIVFIDEIDSIGRKRGAGLGGGHDEREQTLNQMLSEMDGFEATEGIVMMAATNRPDILDPALLRPGRFDRQIVVPLPDLEERLPILQVHCAKRKVAESVDLALVARGTPGMSGADLANLVNEAALHAVRRGATEIEMQDFEAARDRIFVGQKRDTLALSDDEKERVAFHEGGHAVLSYVLEHADPLHKVTILPAGMALGVTHQLPDEERHIQKRDYLDDRLAVILGGRVAEQIIYNDTSTGAANDLVGATEMARRMVREFGMSDKIGPVAWGSQGQVFLGDDLLHSGEQYSEATSNIIDEEVRRILLEAQERSRQHLAQHEQGLRALAARLLERETIDGAEAAAIIDEAHGSPVHGENSKTHYTNPLS